MKMAQNNFILVINLSEFFTDHRQRARIFINEKIKKVEDLQHKIANCFGIENFILTSSNEYLPPAEDVRIIRNDDVVCVIPTNKHSEIPTNITSETLNNIPSSSKRKSNGSLNDRKEKYVLEQNHDENYLYKSQKDDVNQMENNGKGIKKRKKETESQEDQDEFLANFKWLLEGYSRKKFKKNLRQEEEKTSKSTKNVNGEHSETLHKHYRSKDQMDTSYKKSSKQVVDSLPISNKQVSNPNVAHGSCKVDVNGDNSVKNVFTTIPNSKTEIQSSRQREERPFKIKSSKSNKNVNEEHSETLHKHYSSKDQMDTSYKKSSKQLFDFLTISNKQVSNPNVAHGSCKMDVNGDNSLQNVFTTIPNSKTEIQSSRQEEERPFKVKSSKSNKNVNEEQSETLDKHYHNKDQMDTSYKKSSKQVVDSVPSSNKLVSNPYGACGSYKIDVNGDTSVKNEFTTIPNSKTEIRSSRQKEEKPSKTKSSKNTNGEHSESLHKCYHSKDQMDASYKKRTKQVDSLHSSNKQVSNCKYKKDVNGDISVNVATTIPNSITYKKFLPIPTITDEYLKKKKTNIVKIDHISYNSPTLPDSPSSPTSKKEEDIEQNPTIRSESSVKDDNQHFKNVQNSFDSFTKAFNPVSSNDHQSVNCPAPHTMDTNFKKKINIVRVDCISKSTVEEHNEENKAKADIPTVVVSKSSSGIEDGIQINKDTIETDTVLPTTKYFFFDTPSLKEKMEKAKAAVKKKKENMFKIRDSFWISPQAQKNQEVKNDLKERELDRDPYKLKEEHIATEINENKASHNQVSNEVQTKEPVEEAVEHKQIQSNEHQIVGPSTTSRDIVDNTVEVDMNVTLEISEKGKLGDAQVKLPESEEEIDIEVNEANIDANVSDVNERMKIRNKQLEESKNYDISENDSQNNSMTDSCYLSKMSPCISTLQEDSLIKGTTAWDLSGLKPIKHWCANYSGVGVLLDSLRNSSYDSTSTTLNSACDTSVNQDSSKFVTKRKRHRKRKRNPKSKNCTIEETISPQRNSTSTSFKPLKCAAAPKTHIRFDNGTENKEENSEVNGEKEQDDVSVICIDNQKIYEYKNATSLFNWHAITGLPDIEDVIAFKVFKLTDQLTPGVSSEIVGTVKEVSENNLVTFFIWDGIEELQNSCAENMADDDLNDELSPMKTLRWSDLIQPKRGEKMTKY
ncbi:uncharacterized protein [Diabrotica undecimpunctata]|uniref:uncharacterized protein isoform X2 n=1 Tax=Diabrotica undecimpunctata TaxID=50387 RepID=UPI003B6426AF